MPSSTTPAFAGKGVLFEAAQPDVTLAVEQEPATCSFFAPFLDAGASASSAGAQPISDLIEEHQMANRNGPKFAVF